MGLPVHTARWLATEESAGIYIIEMSAYAHLGRSKVQPVQLDVYIRGLLLTQ